MQHLNFSVQRATVSVQRRLLFPSIRKPTRLHRPSTARGASASGGGSKESSTNSAPDAESTASSDAPAEELKYTSGSGGSWKNDQNPAKGFLAPEGEPQLWWVEKYEARRAAEAAAGAVRGDSGDEVAGTGLAGRSSSSSSSSSRDGADSGTPEASQQVPTSSSVVEQEPQPQQSASGQQDAPLPKQPVAGRLKRVLSRANGFVYAVLQVLQLLLVNAALILWPASLAPGGLLLARVWLLYGAYLVFFGGGTLRRMLAHGRLWPASSDRQRVASWGSRLHLVLFVIAVPLLHCVSLLRFCGAAAIGRAPIGGLSAYDTLGAVCIVAAVVLNVAAANALGEAYDRIAPPKKLVTGSVYHFMQHPIYTSYMLLFVGFCLVLHSAPSALLLLGVCATYYRDRTRLEAEVLQEAFGKEYDEYASRTKQFLPLLV